tara:strand:- start:3355 stop:3720 length:366 start_codon:yes stop_codon:yes gene_type:complete
MPEMTIPPQISSPRRNALRSIKGSEMDVNNEIVAKAASATETLERLTDRKKQTQCAPCRSPTLNTANARRGERRSIEGQVTVSQTSMARPAIVTRQKTREGASREITFPRTAVRARMKTRK